MTYDEAVALPDGTQVTAVQPCDGVEYVWLRYTADRVEVLREGQTDARIVVKRPDTHPADQHKYLFVPAAQLDLV